MGLNKWFWIDSIYFWIDSDRFFFWDLCELVIKIKSWFYHNFQSKHLLPSDLHLLITQWVFYKPPQLLVSNEKEGKQYLHKEINKHTIKNVASNLRMENRGTISPLWMKWALRKSRSISWLSKDLYSSSIDWVTFLPE